MSDTKTFWLEFFDHGEWLGAAVVNVTVEAAAAAFTEQQQRFPNAKPGAEWLGAAIREAWLHGCNPGGQVQGGDVTATLPDGVPRNVLMQEDELRQHGLLIEDEDTTSSQ